MSRYLIFRLLNPEQARGKGAYYADLLLMTAMINY